MKHKTILTIPITLVLLSLLVGCAAGARPGAGPAEPINLAQAANLTTTTQIAVHRFDEARGTYVLVRTIDDPAVVTAFIRELDQPLPLQPALFCTAQYELIFQLADGNALTFNYGCVGEEESFLQGGDTPLQDQAIVPPAAFQALVAQ
jgi:hypothetical protein